MAQKDGADSTPPQNIKIGCLSIDCPERRGDACRHDLDGTIDNFVRDLGGVFPLPKSTIRSRLNEIIAEELRQVRMQYDLFEHLEGDLGTENWMKWKQIRNVITDRIEKIIGRRT